MDGYGFLGWIFRVFVSIVSVVVSHSPGNVVFARLEAVAVGRGVQFVLVLQIYNFFSYLQIQSLFLTHWRGRRNERWFSSNKKALYFVSLTKNRKDNETHVLSFTTQVGCPICCSSINNRI